MSRRLVFNPGARLGCGLAGLTSLAVCLLLVAGSPGAAFAADAGSSVADALSEEVRSVFTRVRDAVVKVEASDKNGQLSGTGFFIDPNGTLLTSYSVGGDSSEFIVSNGENRYPAHRLIADCRSGIAILQVDRKEKGTPVGTPFLPLAKSAGLAVATPVMTVAYPMDMPLTPNFGMVAGFDLKYLNRYFATTHIRANVPVQRGEGGAPLLNMRGEVVGVVISGLDGGASCFALPIKAAEKIHRDYVRFGTARPGWLGVLVGSAQTSAKGSSAEVTSVEEKAPALKAGIRKGDIILKIGDAAISAPEDVLNASFFLTAGEKIPITVWREDQELTVDVNPGERAPISSPGHKNRPKHVGIPIGSEDITLRPEH